MKFLGTNAKKGRFSLPGLLLSSLLLTCMVLAGYGINNTSAVEAFGTQALGDLDIGDKVVDPTWQWEFRTGNDYTYETGDVTKPVTWIVVAKNHYDEYGTSSGVTLLSEELIGKHAFDNSTDRGSVVGSNHWGDSGTPNATRGLRKFLNGSSYTGDDVNNYDPSFYDSMSAGFRNGIITITLPTNWAGFEDYTQDKVFIPSTTELGETFHDNVYPSGRMYPYFDGLNMLERAAQLGGSNWAYLTRSVKIDSANALQRVETWGSFGDYCAPYSVSCGVRPALNLQSDTLVSAIPNDDGAYEIGDFNNDDADLFYLAVAPDTLDPSFDKNTTLYTAAVAHDVASLDVTATLSNPNATLAIDGVPAISGVLQTVTLNPPGAATIIDIVVTAEDEITTKTYTISVNRAVEPAPSAWSRLAPENAAALAYGQTGNLTVAFQDIGLWVYDGGWTPLAPENAVALAFNNAGQLAVAFKEIGVWVYDGGWLRLAPENAVALAFNNAGQLAVAFKDIGLWLYDGGWVRLAPENAVALSYDDTGKLAVAFADIGVWHYFGGSWVRLAPENAVALAYDDGGNLAVAFEEIGVWVYDGLWARLAPENAVALAYDNRSLAVAFESIGLWLYE